MLGKVGRLLILNKWKQDSRWYVLAQCDCGTTKAIREDYIQRGMRTGLEISCGCRQKEQAAQTGFKNRKYDYNRTKLQCAHKNMIDRCYNPSSPGYARYGGRDIEVCLEWRLDKEQFIKDVGIPLSDDLQLDRTDTNGNYEPDNVRWVTVTENVRNRSNTRTVTAWGITQPLATWCEECGIPYNPAKHRLNKLKWSPERALSEPWFIGKNQTYKGEIA